MPVKVEILSALSRMLDKDKNITCCKKIAVLKHPNVQRLKAGWVLRKLLTIIFMSKAPYDERGQIDLGEPVAVKVPLQKFRS